MKQTLLLILGLIVFVTVRSQGITLLYTGGGSGNFGDSLSWIQINTPAGQTPIQRAPTALDDVVFSKSQSGISSVYFGVNNTDSLNIGGGTAPFCRSMHISNTDVSFDQGGSPDQGGSVNIYTSNGGFVLIDSGSNVGHGIFYLRGGNPEITDLEINNTTFGTLFTHAVWSGIRLSPAARIKLLNSTFSGDAFGSETTGGTFSAQNCTFNTPYFTLGDSATASLSDCTIQDCCNFVYLTFSIGRNANIVSKNVNITAFSSMNFYTSGSVLSGNVACYAPSGDINFGQEDPMNPLPNIIDGNLNLPEDYVYLNGDLKISGDFNNRTYQAYIYPDTPHIFINNQDIFALGGHLCSCHFSMEFFGNSNSNVVWPLGMQIDTLIVNKTGCAKVTFANSLYVTGEARIQGGQLALDPIDTIPYKMVCTGDLNIYQGGGVFLRRDSNGVVANIAVNGNIHDYNTIVDSSCMGFSNPYNGNITLYRDTQNGGNHLINISSASNIGNLTLIGQTGSDFMLAGNLTVNDFNFINPVKLLLGDHNLVVNGNIVNAGPANYFVTNGAGYLQVNGLGNIAALFPVGTSASYTPATLTNAGTTDDFSVNVQPKVLSAGTNGNAYIAGVVNRTWNINKSTPGAANVTLTLQWNSGDELTGFTRNTSYISHYTSGTWNNGSQVAASGSDPYSLTRTGITGFSPFAVMSPAGVVPITLLDFTGKYRDKAIVLNWSTLTELNTRKFIIEKSNDGVTFSPLADIPAYGSSQVTRNYNYVDNAVVNNINYYRLKMVDNDGYFYSKAILVSAPAGQVAALFPNPVKDQLFFRLKDGLPGSIIRIADAKGTTVRTLQLKAGTTNASINTKNLQSGAYSIIFNFGTLKETLQFIKE